MQGQFADHFRHISEVPSQHDHDEGTVKSIYGSTALILGLGNIGGEFAKRFKALGGHTIGVRRTDAQKPDFVDELYLMDKLEELLPRADVVALSLPETKETMKLIDAHKLARMKKGAILVNVGRGSAIDTDALRDALNSGHLSGAALDVTDPEPVPPDHPLWDTKNVLITPHISGGYNLPETYEKVFQLCADNLGRYFHECTEIRVAGAGSVHHFNRVNRHESFSISFIKSN